MNFKELVAYLIKSVAEPIFGLILAGTVVYFLWNTFQFVRNSDDPEAHVEFKKKLMWGIIAIAVMVSMWGLVNFLRASVNLNNNPISIPAYNA
ncbi:MAG: hypothetical protein PHS95_03255 [Candidatus Pacebacteria bacterium]|nr:hypothetical protein [Candidatus Paceibacterota bacterium]